MLRADHTILWKYSTDDGVELTGKPAFHPALNEIGLIAYDLTFVRLDAHTGKPKCKAAVNGGAVFTQVEAYRRGYLIVADMSGYREKERLMKNSFRSPDKLDYWDESVKDHGNIVWSGDFPIGAELLVSGDELFAVRSSKTSVRLKAIQIPRN